MNEYLKRAAELEVYTVTSRRRLHANAEVGAELPRTTAFVADELRSFGYDNVRSLGGGVVCSAGQGGRTILLRADMDALAQKETSGLSFACTTGACHSCGHDNHTAMLLTAAKLLKEREAELPGRVLFMFQPGEEGWHGAEHMISAGVLEGVDAALGMHCCPMDAGTAEYCLGGTRASIKFIINVHGSASHGATPHMGVSALPAAAAIVGAALQIPSMEVSGTESAVLTFGTFRSGTADNINPELAQLTGTIRVFKNHIGDFVCERLRAVAEGVAGAYRCTCDIQFDTVPSFRNDVPLCNELSAVLRDVFGADSVGCIPHDIGVTDDFACIGLAVPSMMFNIGMQSPARPKREPHDPAVIFDESGLKYGAAAYAACAAAWLSAHGQEA